MNSPHPISRGPWFRQEGMGLIATILVMLIVSVVGAALLTTNMADVSVSANYRANSAALFEADSGLQQTVYDYKMDPTWPRQILTNEMPPQLKDPFPTEVVINDQTITLATSGGDVVDDWYQLGDVATLGDGTFFRHLFLRPTLIESANAKGSKAWITIPVRGTGNAGMAEPSTALVRSNSRILVTRFTVWDNAIFAGTGQAGSLIDGVTQVRGSIHILGDESNPTDLNWSGSSGVWNNYSGGSSDWGTDFTKLPPLPTREWNEEIVQSLDSIIRIDNGTVNLDGTVEWGEPDATGNTVKETLDAIYSDATINNAGSGNVNADEEGPYDAIDPQIPFPTLDDQYVDPDTGTLYSSLRDYLNTQALTVPVSEISANTGAFAYADTSGNLIEWDPLTQTMIIEGVVRVDGDLQLGRDSGAPGTRGVNYLGTGTIYSTTDINVVGDLLPVGNYLDPDNTPVNNLGLIADANGTVGTSAHIKVMAAIYAEERIRVNKQTRVGGALVASYYDLGTDVPRIYQVPRLAAMVPPAMPGNDPIFAISKIVLADWYHIR